MTSPLPVKNFLLPQPTTAPRFHKKILNDGEEIFCADPKATRALLACMNMEAQYRGAASHWGGPSAFAEIMSALHALVFLEANKEKKPWFEKFHLINDAGHCENGLYALKANYQMAKVTLQELKKFRSIESFLTGHGEAHLFPEGVYLSNGPLGSTLGQAQGLSLADKLQNNKRVCVVTLSDGGAMEGEVKESLSALPGFAKKNLLNPFVLIISDNNTKLSGRIDKDSFSLEPTFKSLSDLGWHVTPISEGHDLKTLLTQFQEAFKRATSHPQKPVALWIKTIKGFGVKATEESSSGGHGFPLKDSKDLLPFIQEIYQEQEIPKEISSWCEEISQYEKPQKSSSSFKKTQVGISQALIEKKEKGFPIVSITSDLSGSTGLSAFQKKFPKASFDVGVAEANMISTAVGFSKQGFIPIVDTFAQFAVTKGILPLFMSSLSQAPLIGIFSHIGFQDAADGASHQALSYLANTCSLPHFQVYCLSCSGEAQALLSQTLEEFYNQRKSHKIPHSTLFFLGRETFPEHFLEKPSYHLKKAQVLVEASHQNRPVLIVTCGPLVKEAFQVAKKLKEQGEGVVLINNPLVNDPDMETILFWLEKCDHRLLLLEEHQLLGGFSSTLSLKLHEQNKALKKFKVLALRGDIGRSAYKAQDLYQHFKLDGESLLKSLKEMKGS